MSNDGNVVDVADDSEIVTTFLLSTYRLQPTMRDVVAALASVISATGSAHVDDETETDLVPLISGSSVELYIKPMLSCVDDIDVMFHRGTLLAIPAGYPAPTELPAEFRSRVEVYEMFDSEYPGFVYLKRLYLLTNDNAGGRYTAMMDYRRPYARRPPNTRTDVEYHGPAITVVMDHKSLHTSRLRSASSISRDDVECIRCLAWPSQAADWPTRHRKHGWPDSSTVDRVVSNGCDVVQVAHRLCRQNEWMSKHQFRLSFSRAEILLLNSWIPVQQIVYHMLRVFVKTGPLTKITDNDETKIISNYHIKTLMMWACELKPSSWWTNAVKICAQLFNTLAVWLADVRCSHYFIRSCNLTDRAINVEIITDQLMSVRESWLSTWFVNNYILQCARLCSDDVLRLCADVSTSVKLQTAASAVVDWRRSTALEDLLEVYDNTVFYATLYVPNCCHAVDSYVHFTEKLSEIDLRFLNYFTGTAFLHFVKKISKNDYDAASMDVLSTMCGQTTDRRHFSNEPGSVTLLNQATKLMKDAVNNSRSTVQLIEIELSKAYLYRALRCKDSDNDSIYCLANVYLAVLYYTTGQYPTATDLCTIVMSHDHSQCSLEIVQGELLPKIDDEIDNALGLAVFYQHVRTAAVNPRQLAQHLSVFTTDILAHYLLTRCLSSSKCHHFAQMLSTEKVQRHVEYVCQRRESGLLVGDMLLLKSICLSSKLRLNNKILMYQRQPLTMNPTELDASELVELLQQSAVEHLTTYRQFQVGKFGSVATIVMTDFEAMYAYKRGDFRLCLQLSTQNVRLLLHGSRLVSLSTFPEFIQLLDDYFSSVTALTLIVNCNCREHGRYVDISQLTLSVYLMTQCQLKLHHSATQLAQALGYIKLAQIRHPDDCILNHLILKLSQRKVMLHLSH